MAPAGALSSLPAQPLRLRSLNSALPDLGPGMVAGRSRSAQAVLLDSRFSTQHFRLEADGIVDTSRNGVFVNGARIPEHKAVELRDGDLVTLTVKDEATARRLFGDDKFGAWVVHRPVQMAAAESLTVAQPASEAPNPCQPVAHLPPQGVDGGRSPCELPQAQCTPAPPLPAAPAASDAGDVDEFAFEVKVEPARQAAPKSTRGVPLKRPASPSLADGRKMATTAGAVSRRARCGDAADAGRATDRANGSYRQDHGAVSLDSIFAQIKGGQQRPRQREAS